MEDQELDQLLADLRAEPLPAASEGRVRRRVRAVRIRRQVLSIAMPAAALIAAVALLTPAPAPAPPPPAALHSRIEVPPISLTPKETAVAQVIPVQTRTSQPESASVVIQMETSDPDVIIFWVAD